MQIILIRHGEPVTAESQTGPVDPELSARGRWQAQQVGEWLRHEPVDHIIATTKRRAIETADPLCRHLDMRADIVDDFVEIDRHARVYAPTEVMPLRFPDYWEKITQGRWEEIGWDAPDVFRDRVLSAWSDLLKRRPGQHVVIACHGGTIGIITAHILGIENHHATAVTPPYASCTRIDAPDNGASRVFTLNEIAHFDGVRHSAFGPDGDGFPPP